MKVLLKSSILVQGMENILLQVLFFWICPSRPGKITYPFQHFVLKGKNNIYLHVKTNDYEIHLNMNLFTNVDSYRTYIEFLFKFWQFLEFIII